MASPHRTSSRERFAFLAAAVAEASWLCLLVWLAWTAGA